MTELELRSERMKQRYVPFDAKFGLCSESTYLFLPPSRAALGIISDHVLGRLPLEYDPCEYFCLSFENGSVYYCRPDNGYKHFYHWTFDSKGNAELKIEREGVELVFDIRIQQDNVVDINTYVTNKTSKEIISMYINPCLRYQNNSNYKGLSHENVFLATGRGMKSVPEISSNRQLGERILVLHKEIHRTGTEAISRAHLLESLMKSRSVNLSDFHDAGGETITCMNLDGSEGILFAYDSPLGFFSRSNDEESGCMHVLPLIENVESKSTHIIKGTIMWDKGSVDMLQERYLRERRREVQGRKDSREPAES